MKTKNFGTRIKVTHLPVKSFQISSLLEGQKRQSKRLMGKRVFIVIIQLQFTVYQGQYR